MARGAQGARGDPLVLGTKIESLTEEIETLERESAALELASQALSDANLDLQGRFSPLVGRRAGEYLAQLTDGRYENILFDKDMRLRAEGADALVPRDAAYLSDGAADQMYLAARLAVAELVLPADDPCPLILDDVLATFDDARAARALALFRALAQTRQILFFTCRARESA
jgi:uncharacterized protein YhaN